MQHHNVLKLTFGLALVAQLLLAACSGGRRGAMLAQLEELERQNRADSVMRNDSLARELADYFDRHGSPNERMRAHYILGRTYYDRGELPQALNAYNDAIDCADTTAQDCDYRTLSRVHTQTANLYYSQLLPDNMIRHERLAMKYAQIAKDTMQYLYCYGVLAEGYDMKLMPDTALTMLSETYQMYKKAGLTEMAAGLCCCIAEKYRQKKDFRKAEELMLEYENFSGLFNEKGDIMFGKEIYYSCKGHLCLDTSDTDRAEYYFRKLLGVSYDYSLKCAALVGLRQLYTVNYDKDSLIRYTYLCDSLSNVVHIEAEMQKTLQTQAMYDYTRSEFVASQKEREAEQFKRTLIVVCAIIVIITLIFMLFYVRNQNEKQSLKDRIRLLQGYAVNKQLYDSPIAQHFRQLLRANPYVVPDLNDWKELKSFIEREIPGFREKLQTDAHQLTDMEYDVCLLIKMQVSSSDIARLKQCTPSYVTQIRKRVFKSLFLKSGRADELDEYIMSLS